MRTIVLTEKQSKFVREVGSVVLGVLIALGIGEIAEAVRWKVRVDSSMAAMRTELSENRYNVAERRAYQECLVNRLNDIGQVLRTARRTGILPDVGNVGRPGWRLTQTSAFEVAKSEGIFLHMDRNKAQDLAYSYNGFEYYRTIINEEQNSWQALQLLEDAPGPVSDDLLTTMLQSWATATSQSKWIDIIAQQQDDELEQLGFAVSYEPEEPNRQALTSGVRRRPICAPLRVSGKPVGPT